MELLSYLQSPRFQTVNSGIASYIGYIQRQFGPKPTAANTTESGFAGTVSPSMEMGVRQFIEIADRRQVMRDVQMMFARDPIICEAAQMFVQTAVSRGFSVQVDKTAARGVYAGVQNKAQRIINRVTKDCDLKSKIESLGQSTISDGDLFLQKVVRGLETGMPEVVDAFEMPAASMERLTDMRDHFADPYKAFLQRDLNTQRVIDTFAQWQISHARWNHKGNQRYGNSQYLQLRTLGQLHYNSLIDMAYRRKVRGPLRIGHMVTAGKDVAGKVKAASWDHVNLYRTNNNLTDKLRQGKLEITSDYFSNGMVDWKVFGGDARLGDINDVKFLFNCLFPRLGIAKGLIGFGEDVSRDILDEQREILYDKQNLLLDMLIYQILTPLYDLALLVEGINPDSIVYSIHFEDRATERAKREKAYFFLDCIDAGVMTRRQAVLRLAAYLQITDVESYMKEVEEERLLNLKSQPPQPDSQDNKGDSDNRPVRPNRKRRSAANAKS